MTVQWRKSSRSTAVNDEACVELAQFRAGVGVRDSKNPDGGHLNLSGAQFTVLLGRVKRNELDR
ncbi:MAG: hypothetical protein JWN00_4082 [Actinomycetia bacterium]|nr:hypothetical protein [Actinomycetes bacterium]